jgi:hypothetical protein
MAARVLTCLGVHMAARVLTCLGVWRLEYKGVHGCCAQGHLAAGYSGGYVKAAWV